LWVGNAFAQDRISLSHSVDVIAGVKLEHSSFSGLEVLPNLRIAFHPNEKTLFWSAVSRAVRTPSRIDRQLTFPGLLALAPGFQSEKLIAIEGGYRGQPTSKTTLSISIYYDIYDDIRTTELQPGGLLPIQLKNGLAGQTYGVEAWLTQQIMPWWRISLGAATIGKHFHHKNGAIDLTNDRALGTDPGHQFTARSSMDLGRRLRLDLDGRAVGAISGGVPAYVEADGRLAWQVADALELYVAGENLLHKTHVESNDPSRAQRIARSVYAGTRIRF
jgi:iron complex outermembrane receptor protein